MVMGDHIEMVSVFDEATRDHAAEQHQISMTAALIDAQAVWPFLSAAQSEAEFGTRLALSEDSLTTIAQRHGVSYEEVTAPLARGFAIALEARLPGGGLTCAECGHKDPSHAEGSPCQCGCTSFQAKASKTAAGSWLGEPVPEGSIGNPSRQEMRDEAAKNGRGPSFAPSSVHDLNLHGSTSSPEHFYAIGYDHARESGSYDNYRGYGSRDKTLAYSHGFRHGLADHPLASTSKTAGNGTYDISENCHRGGDGNCDGTTSGGTGCDCACHDEANLPNTMEGVKAWHDGLYQQQDAYDPNYAGEGQWGGYETRVHKASLQTRADQYGVDRQETAGDSKKDEHVPGFGQSNATTPYGQHPYPHGESAEASDAAAQRVREGWGNGMGTDMERGASLDPYAMIRQALLDGQDPLEWIAQQNPPGGPQNALVPSGHDTTQQFIQGGPTATGPVAYTQAMEGEGGTGSGDPSHHDNTQKVGSLQEPPPFA